MNEFLDIINQTGPIVEPVLGGVVTAILSLLFARKNARINSIEEIKSQHFSEVVSDLIADGKMSYMELYECKNFLNIAKRADDMMKDSARKESPDNNYDIDWFIRFFDAVGNVSNEDMQKLWAKILKSEIEDTNSFSLRTIETVHNLNAKEANLFTELTPYILHEQDGMIFLLDTRDDFSIDVNENFGISRDNIMLLQDCGLLGDLVRGIRIDYNKNPAGIWNDKCLLKIRFRREERISLTYKFNAYPLTSVGKQLFNLVKKPSDNNYLISIRDEIAARYSANLETSFEDAFGIKPNSEHKVKTEVNLESLNSAVQEADSK